MVRRRVWGWGLGPSCVDLGGWWAWFGLMAHARCPSWCFFSFLACFHDHGGVCGMGEGVGGLSETLGLCRSSVSGDGQALSGARSRGSGVKSLSLNQKKPPVLI